MECTHLPNIEALGLAAVMCWLILGKEERQATQQRDYVHA